MFVELISKLQIQIVAARFNMDNMDVESENGCTRLMGMTPILTEPPEVGRAPWSFHENDDGDDDEGGGDDGGDDDGDDGVW